MRTHAFSLLQPAEPKAGVPAVVTVTPSATMQPAPPTPARAAGEAIGLTLGAVPLIGIVVAVYVMMRAATTATKLMKPDTVARKVLEAASVLLAVAAFATGAWFIWTIVGIRHEAQETTSATPPVQNASGQFN